MEEKNKEKVVEEIAEKVVEKKEQPRDNKGKFTSKKKIKDDGVVKVDLSKPPPTKKEVVEDKKENVVEKPEVVEEVVEPAAPVLTKEEKIKAANAPSENPANPVVKDMEGLKAKPKKKKKTTAKKK